MTKEELVTFVKLVYATYDRVLVPKDLTEICRAWWPYLNEFELEVAEKHLPNIVMQLNYLPRPGAIRIGILNLANKITPPPIAQEAWANYIEVMNAVNNGAPPSNKARHEVEQATMNALGSLGSLNAQYDRKAFEAMYEAKLSEWSTKMYEVR